VYLRSQPLKLFYLPKTQFDQLPNRNTLDPLIWKSYNLKLHQVVRSKSDKVKIYLIKSVPGCDSGGCEIAFSAAEKQIRDEWYNAINDNLQPTRTG
jgi:hypothetical protein